jgi:cyclomaltodextrin glucanotransferase
MHCRLFFCILIAVLAASGPADAAEPNPCDAGCERFVGTTEAMASDAVYFVITDRFVNGDPGNDQRDQGREKGPEFATFDRPTPGAEAEQDNVGYLGGDFKGVLDNADYIRDMGFGAVWITPIVDNPDEAFTGGRPVVKGGLWTDGGKTGYHGYWGVNFHRLDEHLPSPGLDFRAFTGRMREQGLKVVLDIVANHGSPAFGMPVDQPKFGELYDAEGRLVADHQNLPRERLDPVGNPLHALYNTGEGIAELSDLADANPALLDYMVDAYTHWIDEGADAFRIDTIGWMPHAFWKSFADRIRAHRPGFFMFAEAFSYDAAEIATHTRPENGGYSVLDFPLKAAMERAFGREDAGYQVLRRPLYLDGGPYRNPYTLMTMYDNHDMPRLDADDAGFIDAHNFLFTARGTPVIYYGSEVGFMRGTAEHAGNRNYFGQARVDAAPRSPIHQALRRIARVRAETPALQRGLQVPVRMRGDQAVFYRVLQHEGRAQIALVLLNKSDAAAEVRVGKYLQPGGWRSALDGRVIDVEAGKPLVASVPAHGVEVLVLDAPVADAGLWKALKRAQAAIPEDIERP